MNKPEADLNARVHAYLVFSDFLEVLSSRVGGVIDMEKDPAHLLWTIVTDTTEDLLADIARTKMTIEDDGSFSVDSDVINFIEKIKSPDLDLSNELNFSDLPDSDDDVQIMMSVILERLEVIESKIKNMNEKGNRKY
tara:strand:- start:284 stop:694 length:411 start_codon:yes stop_codon:yes gene_type:complete